MWNFLSKLLAGFSYGAGFMLAIVCTVYVANNFSSDTSFASVAEPDSDLDQNYNNDIEILNVSKLSDFTNYANVGPREEFLFTGELKNHSNENGYDRLTIEIDLYNSDDKFIFKCGGWDGLGITVQAGSTETFQKQCHRMPSEIAENYDSHKVLVKRRLY